MIFINEKSKKMNQPKKPYYFGGPVPRDIQEKLEPCRDRGMTVQNIARKLAYFWISLPVEKQNQFYFSTLNTEFDAEDKSVADLILMLDEFIISNLLERLPKSAKLIEQYADSKKRKKPHK